MKALLFLRKFVPDPGTVYLQTFTRHSTTSTSLTKTPILYFQSSFSYRYNMDSR